MRLAINHKGSFRYNTKMLAVRLETGRVQSGEGGATGKREDAVDKEELWVKEKQKEELRVKEKLQVKEELLVKERKAAGGKEELRVKEKLTVRGDV
jgi:hypothetical protein